MGKENEALVERLAQAFNDGDLTVIDEIIAPDFVGHNPLMPEDMQGPEALKGFFAATRAAMPDAYHPSWALIADDEELVAIHMPLEGTFTHEFMGISPNGKKVVVWMANIWRVEDGKLAEVWFNLDTLGFMCQLGAMPPTDKSNGLPTRGAALPEHMPISRGRGSHG